MKDENRKKETPRELADRIKKEIDALYPTTPGEEKQPRIPAPEGLIKAFLKEHEELQEAQRQQQELAASLPNHISSFAPVHERVWDLLPQLLRQCCEKFTDREERELFLVGALGVISGMLPHVQGNYFSSPVSTNLYCFIIGRYGTGKGSLKWARILGEAIDRHRIAQANDALAQHSEEMAHYNRQMKVYDKGKLPAPPTMPKPPRHTKLYLPANTTKTAVMQLLMENDGRGIIFETEGDTLADMLRQDYGNFSDVLRKAFHHEAVSYFRRAQSEDVFIEHPALSVVLSGTNDQLRRLIPSAENGLFSRFCFYILESAPGFKSPWSKTDDDRREFFDHASQLFLQQYRQLETMEQPVNINLTDAQKESFVTLFAKEKTEIQDDLSPDLDGTVHRMGLITFRIAMILTALRNSQHLQAGSTLTCSNDDFDAAVLITNHLMQYSLHIYETLNTPAFATPPIADNADKKQQVCEVCRQYSIGVSVRGIALSVFGTIGKKSTIDNWIKRFCKKSA